MMDPGKNGRTFPFVRPEDRRRRWKWTKWLLAIGIILIVIGLLVGKVTWAGVACVAAAVVIASGVLGD